MAIKFITKTEERNLIKEYQENNSSEAIEQLLEAHEQYINHCVFKFYKSINKVVEIEDLTQHAKIGLIKAAKQFDLEKKCINPTKENSSPKYLRFLTYAHSWILHEMQSAWYHGYTMHIPAHILRSMQFEKSQLIGENKDNKKTAKLAMNIKPMSAVIISSDKKNHKNDLINMTHLYDNNDKVEIQDPTFDEGIKNIFSPSMMTIISKMNKINWEIFKMKAGLEDGLKISYREIAQHFNMSEKEVMARYKKIKRELLEEIKKNGAHRSFIK